MKFQKGQIPWNKGKKHSSESILKMSESHKRTFSNNPETRDRMRNAMKKRMSNPEYKKKIMENLNLMNTSLEVKQRRIDAQRKAWKNPEVVEIMSKGQKKRFETQDVWNKGMKGEFSEEYRQKISEGTKRGMDNSEVRQKARQSILRRYESNEFPVRLNTKPERQIKEELIKRGYKEGIDFIHQYKFMNKFMCDFCFPEKKVIIEVYGDFWHANPKKYPEGSKLHPHQIKDIGRDKSKEAYIKKVDNSSWTYLVIWEGDIKENLVKCVDKIEEVLRSKVV